MMTSIGGNQQQQMRRALTNALQLGEPSGRVGELVSEAWRRTADQIQQHKQILGDRKRHTLRLAAERRLEEEKGFGCGLRCGWESLPESQEISPPSPCFPLVFEVSANVMLSLWVALTSKAWSITRYGSDSLKVSTLRLVKSA